MTMAGVDNPTDSELEENQRQLEEDALSAMDALASAEEDYNEAKEETVAARADIAILQQELDEKTTEYKEDPSQSLKAEIAHAREEKEEADERLEEAESVENECKEAYEEALKNAVLAEVRRDYSQLKPEADALKKLEAKYERQQSEIAELQATRDSNQDSQKRTGYLDKQIDVKIEKLEELKAKIESQKFQMSMVIDNIVTKFEENAAKNPTQKPAKAAPNPEAEKPKPQATQRTLSDYIKYEATLRQQYDKIMRGQVTVQKAIGGLSQYAEQKDAKQLSQQLHVLERVGKQITHEINYAQKMIENYGKPQAERKPFTMPVKQSAAKNQQSEPTENVAATSTNEPIVQQPIEMAQPSQSQPSQGQNNVQQSIQSAERFQALDKFIGLGTQLEQLCMNYVKEGKDVEENLNESANTVMQVIEAVITQNLALKNAIDLDRDSFDDINTIGNTDDSMTHQHKAEMDIRLMRSEKSETRYGKMKDSLERAKAASQSSSSGGADAGPGGPVVVTPVAPTKLR